MLNFLAVIIPFNNRDPHRTSEPFVVIWNGALIFAIRPHEAEQFKIGTLGR